MNKGGVGLGSGSSGGPTAAAAAAAQKQKALLQRVETNIGNIVDNFSHLVSVGRVQAADSLLKLVSEFKQTAIFSGLASLNDHVEQRTAVFNQQAEKSDRMLARIGEEAAASLTELESHYYSSAQRTSQIPQP
ncbi:hypothetical protein L1049_005074 [Liquidambar formosana]|uniref:Mediator complex subunit 22 n=1 Tax=Liquidambar formosana TaxID=63359 RepID=A0AAP0RP97_LIQFO